MLTAADTTYLDFLDRILTNGVKSDDRTGTGTVSIFGDMLRFNLQEGVPILQTKKIHLHSVMHELAWFLRGESNVRSLQAANVRIWNEWADENGDLGPVYGKLWRDWRGIDQIAAARDMLIHNPASRRNMVTAWDPSLLPEQKLPPCHLLMQWRRYDDQLDLNVTMRSVDAFLGLPFNIASYATLMILMGLEVGATPRHLNMMLGDCHIYSNHMDAVATQLARRTAEREFYPVWAEGAQTVAAGTWSGWLQAFATDPTCLRFPNYDPMPTISAPIAV